MSGKSIKRREFLSSGLAAIALAALPSPLPATGCVLNGNGRNKKMILSFYLDDTNPEIVKAKAFKDFVDYCALNGIKGEASFIPGYNGKSIITDNNQNQQEFLYVLNRAWSKGIDTHMEIITHDTLYDFKNGRKKENGIHEGLWLHEPSVTEQEYRNYFSGILSDAGRKSIKFTGLTWPGCGCEAFKTVAGRIRKHISDKVEWMRPADIVTAYHESGNWEFAGSI